MSDADEWKILGFDTFEGEFYPIDGSYSTVEEAMIEAQRRLKHLEETQPTATSGGQIGGIQDRIYIIAPNGLPTRVMPQRRTREVELMVAKRTMKKLGFTAISWEAQIDGQTVWIEEAHDQDPRFSITTPYAMSSIRSTAADLRKNIRLAVKEERVAETAPDRGLGRARKK